MRCASRRANYSRPKRRQRSTSTTDFAACSVCTYRVVWHKTWLFFCIVVLFVFFFGIYRTIHIRIGRFHIHITYVYHLTGRRWLDRCCMLFTCVAAHCILCGPRADANCAKITNLHTLIHIHGTNMNAIARAFMRHDDDVSRCEPRVILIRASCLYAILIIWYNARCQRTSAACVWRAECDENLSACCERLASACLASHICSYIVSFKVMCLCVCVKQVYMCKSKSQAT